MARLIFGIDGANQGEIQVKGKKTSINSPRSAMMAGMGFCSEDRKSEGIFAELTVRENIILALQGRQGRLSLHPEEEAAGDRRRADQVPRPSRPPARTTQAGQLSGGNQQKVMLARWLATNPIILILDEPTRGIDVGAKLEIMELILNLSRQGMGVIFISSEFEEVVRCSTRIAVLKDKAKIAELERRGHEREHHHADHRGREIDMATWRRLGRSKILWPLVALGILLLFNLFFTPNFFRIEIKEGHLFGNLIDILKNGAPIMLLAIGLTLVIATHGIDISVGSVVAISAGVVAMLIGGDLAGNPKYPIAFAMAAALLVCTAAGMWNGMLVSRIGMQPIIATLILFVAGRGIAMVTTNAMVIWLYVEALRPPGPGLPVRAALLHLHRGRSCCWSPTW